MRNIIIIGLLFFVIECFCAFTILDMQQPKTEWTVTTLKEYFERRLTDLQIAVNKAEEFAKEKFENTNEWRLSQDDLINDFMRRTEAELADKSLDSKINANKLDADAKIQANTDAIKKIENLKQGGNVVWAYVIGAFGMIFGLISLMLNFNKRNFKP